MARQAKIINGNLVEYELRELVDFYDPILRKPTKRFPLEETPQREIEFYAWSMAMNLDTRPEGLGLSANQIGWDYRICAINTGMQNIVLFNPEIIESSPPAYGLYEGCLSYPGLLLKIPRSQKIKVKFQAPAGNWLEETFEGLTAICIQHEIDHLDGIVYSDKVSPIVLDRAKRKVKTNLKKMARFAQEMEKKNREEYEKIKETKDSGQIPNIKIPDTLIPKQEPTAFDGLEINFPEPSVTPQLQFQKPGQEIPEKFVYKIG